MYPNKLDILPKNIEKLMRNDKILIIHYKSHLKLNRKHKRKGKDEGK